MLDRTLNGVRFFIRSKQLKGRQVQKGKRLVWEVTLNSIEKLLPSLPPRQRIKNSQQPRLDKRSGYMMVYMPKHHRAMCDGYIYEQWLVAEKMLGRKLKRKEAVHHKNGVRHDNRPENLHIYPDRSTHMKEAHAEWRKQMQGTYGISQHEK